MKENDFGPKKQRNQFIDRKACYNKKMIFSLLMFLIMFASGCKDKNDTMDTAINEIRKTCITSISSDPNDKWDINNAKYNLGKEWRYEFNKEKVSILYNKSFFFLLQKDATFSNTSNSKIRKHIQTIYSCSGVPPHLTAVERTYFSADPHGMIKVEKTEVLESGKFVVAPTKEDIFFDVLLKQESYEKRTNIKK